MNPFASARSLLLLRVVGYLEGISFVVLLFIAMPLKYLAGDPRAVRVAGLIHGFLFIGFVLALLRVRLERNWPDRKTALAFLAALLPFAIFYADWVMFREQGSAREVEA